MNQLANQIYGGNYQNERQLQAQAAGMSPGLNAAGLANLGMQSQAGGLLQNQSQNYINAAQQRFNYNQNMPRQNLGWYMNTVNSLAKGNTQQVTKPIYHNRAAGAISGGLDGYKLGSSVSSNPYVGLIGAGIGALGGGGWL